MIPNIYRAMDIANYILTKCIRDEKYINNLQLQYILFLLQRKYFKHGKILFSEKIRKVPFGVQVDTVYYHFCIWAGRNILWADEFCVREKDRQKIDPMIEELRELPHFELHKIVMRYLSKPKYNVLLRGYNGSFKICNK